MTKKEIAKYCISLSPEKRAEVLDYIKHISKILSADEEDTSVAHRPVAADAELTTAEKRKIVNAELDAEEKEQTSSASTISNGADNLKQA